MKNPKEGKIVYLKSGNGHWMTIEKVEEDKPVYCVWFDCNGNLQHDSFNKKVLKPYKCKRKKSKGKKKK